MADANLEQSVNSALGLYNGNMNTITIPSEFIEYTRKHSVFHQEALKKVWILQNVEKIINELINLYSMKN